MTMHEQMIVDMADLAAAHLECTACKATTVVIGVAAFKHPPDACPSCGVAWFKGRSVEDMAVRQFIGNIREMATLEERVPVRLRLELARPKP